MKVKLDEVWNFDASRASPAFSSEEFFHKMKMSWILDGQEKYVKSKVIFSPRRRKILGGGKNKEVMEDRT